MVLAHSWGDNVWRTFMRWVTVDDPGWVERHLAAYVNIAGTVLGVSKSTTSLLSGAPPNAPPSIVRRSGSVCQMKISHRGQIFLQVEKKQAGLQEILSHPCRDAT